VLDESNLELPLPIVGAAGAIAGVDSTTVCVVVGSTPFAVGPWIATGACGDAVSGGMGMEDFSPGATYPDGGSADSGRRSVSSGVMVGEGPLIPLTNSCAAFTTSFAVPTDADMTGTGAII